ncbi:hypothetical protein [Paenibacillus sp. N3.4]|uniref:hypothetical protein n=1 Tax=Paenibacillus sp. N3.4 TaxID=2603222 RepID=UPI0011CB6B02|nr:hypothetical protein [Paenibacillus sp. N3.4]TXK84232.1 hypothetical protein FU659_10310 [Paenibacillus sp. N3.4]
MIRGELWIPFTAHKAPFLNGIGTLSMYGLLIVLFITDIRHKLKRKLWYLLHVLAYPIFTLALIHGFYLGTDSSTIWLKMMYSGTLLVLVLLTVIRILIQPRKGQIRVTEMKQM